ncbi:MAG: peptidoglycan-binding protein [Verrucomicrobia bacterium]|nr:peptidoglycan-binding protein [Verrucomicrobiota bacterium]
MPPPDDASADPLAAALAQRASDPFGVVPALAAAADAAAEAGYLAPHARDADEFADAGDRVRAVRKMVFALGYLPEDDGRVEPDPPLRIAIMQFQTEAGVTVDGWVGPETWTALEDLYTFEDETEITRWAHTPERAAVLARAAQRRLVALGLLEAEPHDIQLTPAQLGDAMAAFADIANALKLAATALPRDYSPATLTALFDHDGFVRRLADFDPAARIGSPARRFIERLAGIELWLLHYGVDPGAAEEDAPAFRAALGKFAADLASQPGSAGSGFDPGNFAGTFPAFFRETLALAHEGESISAADARALATELAGRPEVYQPAWLDRIKAIGGQIWDGLKRAWGWFKRLFASAADKVRNVVRLACRLGSEVFALVRDSLAALPAAVGFWFSGELPAPAGIWIQHDGDFDFRVAIRRDASASDLENSVQLLRARSDQFVFALRVLRVVIDALTAGAASFAGPLGAIRLVAGLIGARGDLQGAFGFWETHREELTA